MKKIKLTKQERNNKQSTQRIKMIKEIKKAHSQKTKQLNGGVSPSGILLTNKILPMSIPSDKTSDTPLEQSVDFKLNNTTSSVPVPSEIITYDQIRYENTIREIKNVDKMIEDLPFKDGHNHHVLLAYRNDLMEGIKYGKY